MIIILMLYNIVMLLCAKCGDDCDAFGDGDGAYDDAIVC